MSNTKFFKKEILYKLNNIVKTEKGYTYTFLVGGELKDVNFTSVEQADEWLETIRVQ